MTVFGNNNHQPLVTFNAFSDESTLLGAQWELSGLDTWFDNNEQVTTTTEEEEEEEVEEEPEPADTTKAGGSNTGLYIIGGVGVLAAGYLYFIIRNPKAYVQATAIRTGGGLVSQMLG